MADEPRMDDDELARPPEVTVPPWLRTGPTPDQATPSPSAADDPAAGRGEADRAPADEGPGGPAPESTPSRIRLGAGRSGDEPPAVAGDADRSGDLSSLPLGAGRADRSRVAAGDPAPDPDAVPAGGGRARGIALAAVAGVAVVAGSAVLGFVLTRGALSPVDPVGGGPADCAESSGPGHVSGAGPGSLNTPLETVLAFDHAYYVERSAAGAFEAVSPSSRMTEEQLRTDGVDRVPEGTSHCVVARELSPTLLEVTLTESPPDADPVVIRQNVRVAQNPDGTWGIVSITPAG